MDDESYFTLAHTSINGNGIFYTSNINQTTSSVKYMPVEKFQKKLLVWLCFSENGVSEPFFVPSGLAVNQHVYLDIIKRKLIPFIDKYHSDDNYLFWPDLASAHYSKLVKGFLRDKKMNFVERSDNPPNLPECRPIENFWSILKGKVYEGNWQAENLAKLQTRIKYCLGKIDPKLIQSLAQSIPSLVDNIRRNGLIEK